jgi:hypothetical protein
MAAVAAQQDRTSRCEKETSMRGEPFPHQKQHDSSRSHTNKLNASLPYLIVTLTPIGRQPEVVLVAFQLQPAQQHHLRGRENTGTSEAIQQGLDGCSTHQGEVYRWE